MAVSSVSPPHDLGLVVDFVNTRDIENGTDELATPDELRGWLTSRGLLQDDAAVGVSELAEAVELREALRSALLRHAGAETPNGATALERVAARGRLSVHFDDDGSVGLSPRESGMAGALARLLVPVAEAAADGTWQRVKACAADDCRWAFYDRSRNRSGRWCDMAVCGNRTKVRAYRTKQRE
jgi:predicted RNA-binding Zn ribbon-like protein